MPAKEKAKFLTFVGTVFSWLILNLLMSLVSRCEVAPSTSGGCGVHVVRLRCLRHDTELSTSGGCGVNRIFVSLVSFRFGIVLSEVVSTLDSFVTSK